MYHFDLSSEYCELSKGMYELVELVAVAANLANISSRSIIDNRCLKLHYFANISSRSNSVTVV